MTKFSSTRGVLPTLAALLTGILLAACGGGGKAPILGGISVDATPVPTVTAVSPSPNARAVSINTKLLTASFSKAINPSTLQASSFTLDCPSGSGVTGSVGYLANTNTAILLLPTNTTLPINANCLATLTTDIRDNDGLALRAPYSWRFVTSAAPDVTPPTVTATTHANGATRVPVNTRIGATFSEVMDSRTVTINSFIVKKAGTVVPGTLVYTGVSAVFTPTAALTSNTLYTMTVSTAAEDVAGNAMAADYAWSWTTAAAADTTTPKVIATVHANGAISVPINTKVGATFSEAMNTASFIGTNFLLNESVSNNPIAGSFSLSALNAVFTPTANLTPSTRYTVTIKGGKGGVSDLAGNALASDYVWSWTTAAADDLTAPTVSSVTPADGHINVAVSSAVNATFSEAMDPLTLTNVSFTVQGVTGLVSMSNANTIATFVPTAALAANTSYTATISTAVEDLSGNSLVNNKVWTFTTAAAAVAEPPIDLGSAAHFGSFGGSAGMTNQGTLTVIHGDIGTIATAPTSLTGFHDSAADIYTQTESNVGSVDGKIYTCTHSTTGPTAAGTNADSCAIATQARLDAETAYLSLVAKPEGGKSPAPGENLAGLTLLPGVYKSANGKFMIQGGNLTLDAQGDANATWVFQMDTTLTVGGPGAAFPQSIVLAGGAQAKNVFWQVGSFATLNAAGGGTMVGTIISQAGAAFSTVGNTTILNLLGRVLSLGASVTLVNTVITAPAP